MFPSSYYFYAFALAFHFNLLLAGLARHRCRGAEHPFVDSLSKKSVCLIMEHILFSRVASLLKKESQLTFAYANCLLTIIVASFD